MGVYARPGKIDIAMDLPHPVFWMEACASMPVVLKDRVLEAFRKLHERGVVHGDVALRHILIGADARVTLIDFQGSRADEPNKDVGLARTVPGEKDLEIRRVKFLLNMDNAREKEFKKSKAALMRYVRNDQRGQRRRELLRHGITAGLPSDEPEPLEDINEPPVPLEALEKFWMEDANDDPQRFIVPGASESQVAEAISSFLQCVKDMEGADCGWSLVCNGPSSPRSPIASPSPSPRNVNASIAALPPSIKVRDFAYESSCRSSISGPQEECGMRNHDPSSPLFVDKENISGNRVIISRSPTYPKRHREDEENVVDVEVLPVGKRTRLDDSGSPISRPGTRNHDPSFVEKVNNCGDPTGTLSHSPTYLKRHREDDEEKAAFVEGSPTGKRPRLDDSHPQEERSTRNHDPDDKAAFVEGSPTGKRPRLDDSYPQEERGTRNHDPSPPLSGDTLTLSHSPTYPRRHRDDDEKAAFVEGSPTGKRLRLDDSFSTECDVAASADTKIGTVDG